VFRGGRRLAEFRVKTAAFPLGLGRALGSYCELRAGMRVGRGEAELATGTLETGSTDFDVGAFVGLAGHDTLDNVRFPRHGDLALLGYAESSTVLGDDSPLRLLELAATSARSRGRNTLLGRLRIGVDLDGSGEVQDLFSLGGFLNLSGLESDEIAGRNLALANVIYFARLAEVGSGTLRMPVYAGVSVEYGGVYEDRADLFGEDGLYAGGVLLGADTPVGPLYLGIGAAEGGRRSAYQFLGQTF